MTHAYREMFLSKAMRNTGVMFDFAINEFGIPADDFVQMFTGSEVCRALENGEPKYLVGMSGEDAALRVIEETTGICPEVDIEERFGRTPDHWCGWAVCYYQWLRSIRYKELFRILPYEDLRALYPVLHEADISRFADAVDERAALYRTETNLKRIRAAYGCSQSELASLSGVSLRSIQMYEQRKKDINKGQLMTIVSLARALGCNAEDLLEPCI